MRIILYLSFFLVFLLNSCDKNLTRPSEDFYDQNLFQGWTRSYEEESQVDTIQIFRPSNYKDFPPSRFRMIYTFYENGDCEWLYLHPADAHYIKSGKWENDAEDNRIILIYDTDGKLMEFVSFRIVELRKDILRIVNVDF